MDSMGATRKLMPIPSSKFPIEGVKECFIDTKIFLCITYSYLLSLSIHGRRAYKKKDLNQYDWKLLELNEKRKKKKKKKDSWERKGYIYVCNYVV